MSILTLLDGNEAIARGAMAAGCDFFAGYPITPATSIYHYMLQLLPPSGGICMQGEDEIASIGFCLGAAMAGQKAMTATSGPGISLYSEHISFAIAGEIPVVIVDVQRLGPSTGSATKGADGDIQFLRWGNSGGLPLIVLAPVDSQDCYQLAIQSFFLAQKYRCPVFIASNKEIGMTKESIDFAVLNRPENCTCPSPETPLVSPLLPIGEKNLSRQTSSTHGADGYITADPAVIEKTITRLREKLLLSVDDYSFYTLEGDPESSLLLVVYGVTARAARQAVSDLNKRGHRTSLLILKTLYPVPGKIIKQALLGKSRILVVEMNRGQYVREIERLATGALVEFYGKMNGELITPEEIMAEVVR